MEKTGDYRKLDITKFFQEDFEKIQMASRLSEPIQKEIVNIRTAGDIVEIAVRQFYKDKLFPSYHVSTGHLIDSELCVSSQLDLVISDNTKNPVFTIHSDSSEILFFESVFAVGEIKKSLYNDNLLTNFSDNIKKIKTVLTRESIDPRVIQSSNFSFSIGKKVTDLPYRNPLLFFMFFVSSRTLDNSKLRAFLRSTDTKYLPNFIIFLDLGILLNVNSQLFDGGTIKINLYPEFEEEDNKWVLLRMDEQSHSLMYSYLLIIEHLNKTIVSVPDLYSYLLKTFNFPTTNFDEI